MHPAHRPAFVSATVGRRNRASLDAPDAARRPHRPRPIERAPAEPASLRRPPPLRANSDRLPDIPHPYARPGPRSAPAARLDFRSEEHTSELQSLMRISYAVFCLKKKTPNKTITTT